MPVQIRVAQIADVDALFELNELFNGVGSSKEYIKSSLSENEQETVFVATVGDSIVGFCCVQLFKSMCYSVYYAEITELFVKEEYRKQGAGAALMHFAEEYYKEQNVRAFQLFTGKYNTNAQAFYAKMGYTPTDEIMYRKRVHIPIISSHNVTLYGGNEHNIILKPLSDEHLPLLYKWNADPEVLYWTEGDTDNLNLSYTPDTVHQIYGGVSKNAFCFLIEVDNKPIGECWLQKMNLPNVLAMYASTTDVRRIDMCIGEKDYWNKGLGTEVIRMLIDFAFYDEHVDVLHCFCEDYNKRSQRMWQKNGFTLALSEDLPQPQKGKYQYHYTLTRQQFIESKRGNINYHRL